MIWALQCLPSPMRSQLVCGSYASTKRLTESQLHIATLSVVDAMGATSSSRVETHQRSSSANAVVDANVQSDVFYTQ